MSQYLTEPLLYFFSYKFHYVIMKFKKDCLDLYGFSAEFLQIKVALFCFLAL